MRRRFWPWTSILAAAFFGVLMVTFAVATVAQIVLHRWPVVVVLIVTFAVVAAGATMLLLRLRSHYDYYIESDGESLRWWTPTGETAIRRQDVIGIERRPGVVVVKSSSGEIAISRAYAGYRALRRIVESWPRSGPQEPM